MRPQTRQKIIRAMRDNGSPPPEFDFDEDHSYFLVRLPVHPATVRVETGNSQMGGQSQG
ncbi:MAG: hypothetical protein HY787_11685 [Deltaproteobacteria bacterium]|nr:hypothetical protein [Deltaproteobacteria bacterium]